MWGRGRVSFVSQCIQGLISEAKPLILQRYILLFIKTNLLEGNFQIKAKIKLFEYYIMFNVKRMINKINKFLKSSYPKI